MDRKILGLLAAVAIVATACAGTTTTASTAPSAGTPSGSGSAPPSNAASPTPLDFEQILFGYDYQPEPGTPGGSIVVSDLFYYLGSNLLSIRLVTEKCKAKQFFWGEFG